MVMFLRTAKLNLRLSRHIRESRFKIAMHRQKQIPHNDW